VPRRARAKESSSQRFLSPEEKFMRVMMRCLATALLPIFPALSDAAGAPPASTVTAFGTVAVFANDDANAREIPAAAPSQEDADDRLGLADFDPYPRDGVKLTA
jgi:hypothetical protein